MKNFTYLSNVTPGKIINMMSGLKTDFTSPFEGKADGISEPVDNLLSNLNESDCYFGPFPRLQKCENWTDLVSKYFSRFKVSGRQELFSGFAALQKHSQKSDEILNTLCNFFNIPLEYADDDSGYSFVLVSVNRNLPNAVINFSSIENSLTESIVSNFQDKVSNLENLLKKDQFGYVINTPENISQSLKSIDEDLGSHYIDSVELGDEAYQVFVYDNEKYKLICTAMDKSGWDDVNALSFRYFTSSEYCTYKSKVNLLSNDPDFKEILPLLNDKTYGLEQSIFSLVMNEDAQAKSVKLKSIVCVGAELNHVTELIPQKAFYSFESSTSMQDVTFTSSTLLKDITIQGCVTRFGAQGAGPAVIKDSNNIDYQSLYDPFGKAEKSSMLWSPYLSIAQMYVNLDDLWNSPLLYRTGAKHLIITADVIEIQEDIDLSKIETVTFACRLLITGKNGSVPTVTLSKLSWNPLRLYCGSMIGTCVFDEIDNPLNHRLVYDTLAVSLAPSTDNVEFQDFFAGKFPVKTFYETGKDNNTLWRKTALQNGLETLLMTASVPLTPQALIASSLKQTAQESWNCLNWIIDSSRQVVNEAAKNGTSPPEELAWVYSHGVMLLRTVVDPNDTSSEIVPQVPPLRYTAYKPAVDDLLELCKTYGQQIDISSKAIDDYNQEIIQNENDENRDENIKKIAQFFLNQNEALAQHEDDITESHKKIINEKESTILSLNQNEASIRKQYLEYTDKMNTAAEEMNNALKNKIAAEKATMIVNFVFGLTEAMIGIGTGVYGLRSLGSASGVEKTLKKLESFMKFAEQANKIIEISEDMAEQVATINELDKSEAKSDNLPGLSSEPNDADWEIYLNDSKAQVAPAEEYIKAEVEKYIASVSNLTVIAKQLNTVLRQKSQLQFDIFSEKSQLNVSKNQADRLRHLSINMDKKKWTPDNDYLADLGQFNAVLRQKQNTVLLKLAELLRLQDDSLTFHYLSKPTVMTQFDIASIQKELCAQSLSAVKALETYPNPPVDSQKPIEITIDNISVAELTSDIGINVQVSMNSYPFNTLARVRINSIDVRVDGVSTDTNQCHVQLVSTGNPMQDRGLKREVLTYKTISRKWDVVYDIKSDTTIIGTQPANEWGQFFTKPTPFQTFSVSLPNTPENAGLAFSKQFTKVTLKFMLEALYSQTTNIKEPILSSGLSGTPDFVNALKGYSITDGWDVVSFVSVDRINSLWKERWDYETKNEFEGDPTFLQNISITHTQNLPGKIRVEYTLDAKTGSPWLNFVADNDQSILVNIPIISGKMTTTTFINDKESGSEETNIESTSDKPVLIKTRTYLKKLQGEIDKNHVYIDPAQDAFLLENIDLDPQVEVGFCDEIAAYFKHHKLQPWLVGTLRLTTDIPFLSPKTFNFRTFTPPDLQKNKWPSLLAIYILTTTQTPPRADLRQSWPDMAWPVSPELDAAVYFSSKLLWDNEIIPEVKKMIPDATIVTKENQLNNNIRDYSCTFQGSSLLYETTISLLNGWYENSHTVSEYASVHFDLSKILLNLNMDGLELSCNTEWNENFPYQGRVAFRDDFEYVTKWEPIKFKCSFDSNANTHIAEDSFIVSFDELKVDPVISADNTGSHIFSFTDTKNMQDNAKAAITTKLTGFDLKLKDMPMFAVSNLLFPESKTIEPKGVYFPYDMVIVGDVVRSWIPPKNTLGSLYDSKNDNMVYTPKEESYFVYDSNKNRLLVTNDNGEVFAHDIYNNQFGQRYKIKGKNIILNPYWDRHVLYDRNKNRLLVVNCIGEVFAYELDNDSIGMSYKINGEGILYKTEWDKYVVFDSIKNRLLVVNSKGEIFGHDLNDNSIADSYRINGNNIILNPDWDRFIFFDETNNRLVVTNCIGEAFGHDLDEKCIETPYRIDGMGIVNNACTTRNLLYNSKSGRIIVVQ